MPGRLRVRRLLVRRPLKRQGGALIPAFELSWFGGDRRELRDLFALAEESPAVIDELIDEGRVLVAGPGDEVVGCLQLLEPSGDGEIEIALLAVAEGRQGEGIGSALLEHAIGVARDEGLRTVRLGTSSADIENLRFYQRRGFRLLAIERDAFTEADGYPKDLSANGIPVRDRVWLTRSL